VYSNWYSCLHFPDTTTLTDRCHLLPRFQTLLRGATFSTPVFSRPATAKSVMLWLLSTF